MTEENTPGPGLLSRVAVLGSGLCGIGPGPGYYGGGAELGGRRQGEGWRRRDPLSSTQGPDSESFPFDSLTTPVSLSATQFSKLLFLLRKNKSQKHSKYEGVSDFRDGGKI